MDNNVLNSETLGYFMPSFFSMYVGDVIDNQGNIDLNKLDEHDFSVFFHEYVHYIQDVTTFNGLNRAYVFNELFKDSNRIIKTNKNVTFPIKLQDLQPKVCLKFLLQNRMTRLDHKSIDRVSVSEFEIKTETISHGGESIDVKIVKLKLKNTDTSEDIVVELTSTVLAESMAYLLQRMCTKIDYESPEYPYCIAEKLAIWLCSSVFENHQERVVALCDASLLSSSPGLVFMKTLYDISKNRININRSEDIIDYVLNLKGTDPNGREASIKDYHTNTANQISDILKEYVEIKGKNFGKNIKECFNLGLAYRKKNPYFFARIAEQGYVRSKNASEFLKVITEFGTPLIFDKDGNYAISPSSKFDNEFMTYFRAIQEMVDFYFLGKRECGLLGWCSKLGNITNEKCKTCPIDRVNDNQLCPVAVIWRNWGMKNYKPM